MISLIFLIVASAIFPSVVLGKGCCFPDRFFAVSATAGKMDQQSLLVDFTQKKVIMRPLTGDVTFMLNDFGTKMTYTKYTDGSCSASHLEQPYMQCLPDSFQYVGSIVFAKTVVKNYRFQMEGGDEQYATVTEECEPVVRVMTMGGVTSVQFFANVTSSVTDVSDLNQDVSGCTEAE